MSQHQTVRPWWWWLNPWLYAVRRDLAYEDALDIISDIESPLMDMVVNPYSVMIANYKVGRCKECNRKYIKERLIEQQEAKP